MNTFAFTFSRRELDKGIRKPTLARPVQTFKSKKQYVRKNDHRQWED